MDGETLTRLLRKTMLTLVRRDDTDLTARQLSVLLTICLTDGPHTVRGLAAELDVCKPAITRVLDRLGKFGLIRRRADPLDRRSVIVKPTDRGWVYLAELGCVMGEAWLAEMPTRNMRIAA